MKIKLLLFFLIPCISTNVFCQDILDPTFPTDGITFTNASEYMNACHIKSNDKILLTGYTGNGNANADFVLAQFNADGTTDFTFGTDGFAIQDSGGVKNLSYGSVIQPDGKIIVVGETYNYPAQPQRRSSLVMRFNEDGTPDTAFGNQGILIHSFDEGSEIAYSAAIDADGNIWLAMHREYLVEPYVDLFGAIAKVSPTGDVFQIMYTIPAEFSENRSKIFAIKVLPDGKILFAGYRNPEIFSDMALGKLNSDGTLDTDFGTNGYTYFSIDPLNSVIEYSDGYQIHLVDNGKILMTGYGRNYDTEQSYVILTRVHADGSPDGTFGTNGRVLLGQVTDAIFFPNGSSTTVLPNGKIMIGGAKNDNSQENSPHNFAFALRNENGSPDQSFGTNGYARIPLAGEQRITALAMQSEKVVAVGYSDTATVDGFALMRLEETGLGILPQEAIKVSVYPNPTATTLFINPLPVNKAYAITDITGKIIVQDIMGVDGIAVENLANGVYFLQMDSYHAVKFVKE